MNNLIFIALMQISIFGAEQGTFEQAYQQSKTSGKPFIVLIGATWCPGCQTMKNSILPQVAEAGGLDGVVFYYIDFDEQRKLATRLKRASPIPQLIRFEHTTNGWKAKYLIGVKSPREVYRFINVELPKKAKSNEVSTAERPPVPSEPQPPKKATPTKQKQRNHDIENLVLTPPLISSTARNKSLMTQQNDSPENAMEIRRVLKQLDNKQVSTIAIFPTNNASYPIILRSGYTQDMLFKVLEKTGYSNVSRLTTLQDKTNRK